MGRWVSDKVDNRQLLMRGAVRSFFFFFNIMTFFNLIVNIRFEDYVRQESVKMVTFLLQYRGKCRETPIFLIFFTVTKNRFSVSENPVGHQASSSAFSQSQTIES